MRSIFTFHTQINDSPVLPVLWLWLLLPHPTSKLKEIKYIKIAVLAFDSYIWASKTANFTDHYITRVTWNTGISMLNMTMPCYVMGSKHSRTFKIPRNNVIIPILFTKLICRFGSYVITSIMRKRLRHKLALSEQESEYLFHVECRIFWLPCLICTVDAALWIINVMVKQRGFWRNQLIWICTVCH